MEITELVVPEAIMLSSCTSAVLARPIECLRPILLMDEIDKLVAGDEDLRVAIFATINSGYKDSGYRLILEPEKGGGWKPKKLSTFSPKMLGGISSLPPDTLSRCIPFEMERMLPNDRVAEIDEFITEPEGQKLCDRAQKCARENHKQLRDARPDAPASLGHRQREICRPLFSVADCIGGPWPERIRSAVARVFADRNASPSANVGVQLLQSIKRYLMTVVVTGCHQPIWFMRWSTWKKNSGRHGPRANR